MASLSSALTRRSSLLQWSVLLAISAVASGLLELAGLPAALLIGPMIAGILVATSGSTIRVPRRPHFLAQTVIGCLVASAITPAIIGTFLREWPLFLGIGFAILIASSFLGWLMGRFGVLPGTTAVWGLAPGAATAMMLMSGEFGADARLVAFMQYLRVVFVAAAASLVARFWVEASGMREIVWFPPIHWLPFAETVAIAVFAGLAGRLLRIPAGGLLGPMIVGAILQGTGVVTIELPEWLLAASYAFLGWNIGLGFTREILGHAARALPQTVLAILTLIAFSVGLAFMLVKSLGIDPLTAYLATSPGGMDSVAIIAAASDVDLGFVMAMQAVRFLVVLLVGPSVSRFFASTLDRKKTIRRPPAGARETLTRVKEDEGDLN